MSLPLVLNLTVVKGDSLTLSLEIYADNNITHRGLWNNSYAYQINDAVTENEVVYKCIADHKDFIPPNATYWALLTPMDLSLSVITCEMRLASGSVVGNCTINIIDVANGKLELVATAAETALWNFEKAIYDLEITFGTNVKTYLTGVITVNKEENLL